MTCGDCANYEAGEARGGICVSFPIVEPGHGTVHALAFAYEDAAGCDEFKPRTSERDPGGIGEGGL